tara:strand:- start:1261 stop:3441 length:2181 start_codon:yes stop_codon:yes gene_type:complete
MKKILFLLLLPLITFGQKEVIINIKTDSYPSETKWVLYDSVYQGDTLFHVPYGHYTQSNTMNSDTVYIADSITNISFVIFDSYGDGINNGEYYVIICGDTIVDYPVSTFTTGLIHNRTVPQCMPNPPPGVGAKVIINLDQYQSETSWDIKDTNGTIYASGGNYNSYPDYATVIEHVNIPKGDLLFTIYDSYGDGLNGSLWQGQDGSYYVIQCNDTLVYGIDPAFGNDTIHTFVSDSCPPIWGCMDSNYLEFNPFATISDSSCSVLKIYGCIDSTMYNYDSTANTMNMIDSCDYTLILHDLMGNGWVGSKLTIYADDTTDYFHTGGFNQIYNVPLKAPRPITIKFFITSQAALTTIECGFTLINPEGDTLISVQPPFIQPLLSYTVITNCGNTCEEKSYGCIDSTAVNYIDSVNTDDGSCYYNPGCMNPLYLEYDSTADYDNGTCETLIVLGCMDSTALNYNPNANVEIPGSCITIVYGCMNPLAFNYNPNANVDDSTCIPIIYGCTDITMYNYDSLANTDDGSCVPFVYGCTDSTMFNFNPLANADNNTCIPFIYGCTDPSMFNYNPDANTEDFSCVPIIYGCMDSSAFNYDSTANIDNGSCIEIIEGCMDSDAHTYNSNANLNNSDSCFYDAGCITGTGLPYWLNDPCYAWVIEVDEYCCENEWDTICQATYNYCEGTWTGPLPKRFDKQLLMITDILGRPTKPVNNQVLFFIYDDGTVEKKYLK